MKLLDCSMYFDEDLMLDLRLNTLNNYVDKFIIAEATRDHSGKEKKLNFDYKNFSKEDQSRLVSNISNVTFDFSNNFMSSILIFISEILVILSIFIFMLFYKFWFSITLIVIILILSFLYFKSIAPKLKNYGSRRLISEENVIKYCKLGFQNIKELKIFSKEMFFINIFKKNTKESEQSNFFYNFSAQFPRIGIELFSIFGICWNIWE